MALVARECPFCLKPSTVDVPIDGLLEYRAGALVQDAFPELSADEREIFITGIHPSCWDELVDGEADLGGEA